MRSLSERVEIGGERRRWFKRTVRSQMGLNFCLAFCVLGTEATKSITTLSLPKSFSSFSGSKRKTAAVFACKSVYGVIFFLLVTVMKFVIV
jgi:hypothetical protein